MNHFLNFEDANFIISFIGTFVVKELASRHYCFTSFQIAMFTFWLLVNHIPCYHYCEMNFEENTYNKLHFCLHAILLLIKSVSSKRNPPNTKSKTVMSLLNGNYLV